MCCVLCSINVFGQRGTITGTITNKINNEPVSFANIVIQGTSTGAVADDEGRYTIGNLTAGQYNLEISFVGFRPVTVFAIQVTESRTAVVDVQLEEAATTLDAVDIVAANRFYKSAESPLSLRSIGPVEIKQTPGGNRDISKVIRSFPGVSSTPSFRNDIIIRGGAPSENSFYLDGIQIPVINHFQTQGSSGGPVGIINVDLLSEVNFYSGAFPANRGNTMSSVFDFSLKEGRKDKWTFNGIVGATDLGVTFEGPVSEKSSIVFSARRSYLKFLFGLLNLPFLPVYNDVQFKYKMKLNDRNAITLLGIGAIDDFTLNYDAPEKAKNEEDREEAQYILNAIPVSKQWNYTAGLKYEHFRKNATTSFIVGFSELNTSTTKYQNNDSSDPSNLTQDYLSRETELRIRAEDIISNDKWQINYGVAYELAFYDTRDFNKIVTQTGFTERNYSSKLSFIKYAVFGHASRTIGTRLTLSAGLRMDANDYSNEMNNPIDQLSPRVSASYALTQSVNLNFNAGIYYQLPTYTVLGYRDSSTGELTNKSNDVTFISSKHLVSGVEFNLERNARITLEGFYKHYDQYPFLLEDSISLANLGADFGTIGNAPVTSSSRGRSYGVELLLQQKLYEGFYGLVSYTWFRSEFTSKSNEYIPSSWDSRHLVSLTGGKKLGRNWEIALRWLYTGGGPYTPYDVPRTVYRQNWDVRPYGVPDYDRLNTGRISAFHQLDLRVDKKYYFAKWSLNVYFDIQNAYNHVTEFQDNIDVQRNADGTIVIDPVNPDYYVPKFIQNTYGQVLPTIGLIVEL